MHIHHAFKRGIPSVRGEVGIAITTFPYLLVNETFYLLHSPMCTRIASPLLVSDVSLSCRILELFSNCIFGLNVSVFIIDADYTVLLSVIMDLITKVSAWWKRLQ